MTLAAIVLLIVTVVVLWRLVRLAIRAALLLALVGLLLAVYSAPAAHHARQRARGTPTTGSVPQAATRPQPRPSR
ncbi:MAG: hypothetical protein ABSG43_17135 [Solirubrobacteraceae bacterium]